MNTHKAAEGVLKVGVEAALLPMRVPLRVGHFALQKASEFFEGDPDIVESRLAEMPLNEAKIASQQIDIADNRLDFPTEPVTVAEETAYKRGKRVQKAMIRNAFTRLGQSILYADANPIVPDEITDEVVAIATKQRLNPERLDEKEFEEIDRRRISKVLMQRQGNRPPFSMRQVIRAILRP